MRLNRVLSENKILDFSHMNIFQVQSRIFRFLEVVFSLDLIYARYWN